MTTNPSGNTEAMSRISTLTGTPNYLQLSIQMIVRVLQQDFAAPRRTSSVFIHVKYLPTMYRSVGSSTALSSVGEAITSLTKLGGPSNNTMNPTAGGASLLSHGNHGGGDGVEEVGPPAAGYGER
jgi:hypothetical protein